MGVTYRNIDDLCYRVVLLKEDILLKQLEDKYNKCGLQPVRPVTIPPRSFIVTEVHCQLYMNGCYDIKPNPLWLQKFPHLHAIPTTYDATPLGEIGKNAAKVANSTILCNEHWSVLTNMCTLVERKSLVLSKTKKLMLNMWRLRKHGIQRNADTRQHLVNVYPAYPSQTF